MHHRKLSFRHQILSLNDKTNPRLDVRYVSPQSIIDSTQNYQQPTTMKTNLNFGWLIK